MTKFIHIILFTVLVLPAIAQKQGIEYRTWAEDDYPLHYLKFSDIENCTISIPYRNHGEAMMGRKTLFNLGYTVITDTILFSLKDEVDGDNPIINRFVNGKFVKKHDSKLYDIKTGIIYFDKKIAPPPYKYTIYVVNGKIIKQKNTKVDFYGLVKRTYKQNCRLKKALKEISVDNGQIQKINGREAFYKYGMIGVNGVVEIIKK